MALVLYGPALALNQSIVVKKYILIVFVHRLKLIIATGLNLWLSVISIGLICTFYSSVVGMINE